MLNFIDVKRYERTYGDPLKKLGSLVSQLTMSLRVIGTDTDRSATNDFLLTILYCLQDIARYWPKLRFF